MIPAGFLIVIPFFSFLKLIIFIACSLKGSEYFFIESLPLYSSCLCSMVLNEHVVHIEKPDEIFPLTVVDKYSLLFFYLSIFLLYIQNLHK